MRDARGKETSYAYDGFDRLDITTYPDTTTEVLGYDKASNITSRKNRRNQTIAYAYDALNRLDTKTPPDTGLVDYDYDPGSRLTDVTDSNGTTHYDYVPGVNRLQSVTYGYGGPSPRVVSYLYDAAGNRTRLTYPDGGANYITYVWDQMNRLDEVKDSSESAIADYAYDTLSRRTQADLLNGTRAEYGYDEIDRLTSLVNKKVSPESIFSEYLFALYDDVGNLKQMARDGNAYTFGYDAIYQLKTTDYPEGHHSADKTNYYDALGNRTSVIGDGLESYTTNNLNQYTRVGGVDFSYDGDGNLTDDGTSLYEYDSENRLNAVRRKSDNELVAEYEYDPFGRRTRKTLHLTPSTTNFIYDGDQVIEERNSGGSVLATYVYGPGIDECLSMERSGETYYYHYDRLGSVVNLSDSSGDLAETYQYDAWGNADTYGSVGNPYFFTGRRYDPETGNYYYRARYYKPSIGRFLQTDPLGYFDGPNLYIYCSNNALNLVDALGLCKSNKKQISKTPTHTPTSTPTVTPTPTPTPSPKIIELPPPLNQFSIRAIAGGGGGWILGGEGVTYQMRHDATGRSRMYTFVGGGASFGAKAGGSGPSSWTTFYTHKQHLTEDSFYGYAISTGFTGKAAGGGGYLTIDWITGPASGETVADIGLESGFAAGAASSHGYMFQR